MSCLHLTQKSLSLEHEEKTGRDRGIDIDREEKGQGRPHFGAEVGEQSGHATYVALTVPMLRNL